jgi:hypothetical protein
MIHKTLALLGALLLALAINVSARADEVVPNLNHQATVTTVQTFIDKDGVAWKVTIVETRKVTYAKVTPTTEPAPIPTPTPTTPTPTPVPTTTTPPVTPSPVTAYKDSSGQPVTQVKTGSKLVIVGTGFGAPAPAGNRVALNGIVATIESWTDTAITVTVPTIGPTPTAVVLKLFSLASASSNWVLVATGPSLTVNP